MKMRVEGFEIEVTKEDVETVFNGLMAVEDNKTKNDVDFGAARLSSVFTYFQAMWPLFQEAYRFFSSQGGNFDEEMLREFEKGFPGFKKVKRARRPPEASPYMEMQLSALPSLKSAVRDMGSIDVICEGWHLTLSTTTSVVEGTSNDVFSLAAVWFPGKPCTPMDTDFLAEILGALGVPGDLESNISPRGPEGPYRWVWESSQPSGGFKTDPEPPYSPEV